MTRSEIDRIEEQLRLAFEGPAWHGPAVAETLADVTAEQAAARPIAAAHGIWELALHLTGTYGLVLRRLRGDGTQLTPEQDWPAVPEPTADNWKDCVERLRGLNQELRQAVRAYPADRLDAPLVAESPYAAYTQFIGVTQHDLYHAGQIALARKALK